MDYKHVAASSAGNPSKQARKAAREMSSKRKPISALDEDYDRIFPTPSVPTGKVDINNPQRINKKGEVALSINSMKVDRSQRV